MISLRILSFHGQETREEIMEAIKSSRSNVLSLLFPRNSDIFKQKTDLQQLRDECDEIHKEITIITQNPTARKAIESIGIRTLPSLEFEDGAKFTPLFPKHTQKTDTSILENSEEIEEHISDTDIHHAKHKEKILEKLEEKPSQTINPHETLEKLNISYIPIDTRISTVREKKTSDGNNTRFQQKIISKPVLHSLFILAGIATLLFFFILQTVIPAANIIIEPARKEEEMHINANFLDETQFTEPELWETHNGVFIKPLQSTFVFTDTFTKVSKEFHGENASGELKIINNSDEDITLRESTKMQFEDNLVIQLPDWEKIPAHSSIIIQMTFPPKDAYGTIIGERGNQEIGEKLRIPGLPEEMQKEIYAETHTAFTGGKSVWKYKIQKDDFEKAKKAFKKTAEEKAKQEADKLLRELNAKENNAFHFLSSSYKSMNVEVLEYKFADNEEEFQALLQKEQGFINAEIKVRVSIYAYNINDILQLISNKYKNIAPDGMFLKSINADILTATLHSLSEGEEKTKMKASFSTRGIYEYSLEPKSDIERIFIMNAKKEILEKNETEAEKLLINNFPEIASVDIKLSPFWVKSLPKLPEKIHITIHHD